MKFYGDYQVYSESGIDLTLLRTNLQRTATERLKKNSRGIRLITSLAKVDSGKSSDRHSSNGSTMELQIEAIFRELVDHKVDFVLIGGLAMRAQGSAHITEDLDICYNRSLQNITALVAALTAFHPYLRGAPPGLPFRFDEPTVQAGLNFTLVTDLGDIDLLGEVSGVGKYEQALAQSEEKNLFERQIHVLTIDGLIAAKTAAGRLKDRIQLLELEELKRLRDTPTGETPPGQTPFQNP